jgi:glycosyltransferase involved in cell wall biosynthesis
MKTPSVTAIVATKNEEANLARCLASIHQAERILVVDSRSTDRTVNIALAANAEVFTFDYCGGYPKKRQWALNTIPLTTEWVLMLDADEVVPPALWDEIREAIGGPAARDGYLIQKGFHFLGRRLRFGGFSHRAVALLRADKARFEELFDGPSEGLDMEVHERVMVVGTVGRLRTPLIHEDFKGLTAYLDKHNRYSTWEAHVRQMYLDSNRWGKLTIKPRLFGNSQERRRFLKKFAIRIPFESWLWFVYHYFVCLGVLEGMPGLIASQIRMQYISNVRSKLYELRTRTAIPLRPQAAKR